MSDGKDRCGVEIDPVQFVSARPPAIDTNRKSVFFLGEAAGKHMIGQGSGKIVNIASMRGFQGGICAPNYAASTSSNVNAIVRGHILAVDGGWLAR